MARVEDRWLRRDRKTRTGEYGRGKRWRAVWEEPDGTARKQSFRTKDEAEAHLDHVAHEQRTGVYVPGRAGEAFVADLLPRWVADQPQWKASTRAAVDSDVRAHLAPYWGDWAVGSIRRRDVQDWVRSLPQAPRTVGTIHGRLVSFLGWCAEEQLVGKNPAEGVRLPRGRKREHIFLTVPQVGALAAAAGERYGDLVWLLATTGLRIGEASELRVRDLHLGRARLRVERSVVFVGGGAPVVGPPKNGKARSVPLTPAMRDALRDRVRDLERDDLVFTTARGMQVRANNFKRRDFDAAVARANEAGAGIPAGLWVHDLRHTAASWAVQSGASVKAVQVMLGHATAAVTLDTYAGLFDQDLDDVASRMGYLVGGKLPGNSPGPGLAA